MKIDSYDFGRISVGGMTYTSDLIIYPEGVEPSWWRREGHRLTPGDLDDVIAARPDLLIIGTGYSGVMAVPAETLRFLEDKGIDVRIQKTTEAVELFNSVQGEKKVIAALHLTC